MSVAVEIGPESSSAQFKLVAKAKDDDSTTHDVLSLQERCLLYLITHVEDYSPRTLALLPRHLRRALLSSVAPLHLYRLDHTEVACGIDTEEIWSDVFGQIRSIACGQQRLFANFTFKCGTGVELREVFINAIFRPLLQYSPLQTLREIYAIKSVKSSVTIREVVSDALVMEMALFGLFHSRLSTGMIRHLQRNTGRFGNIETKDCFVSVDSLGHLLRHSSLKHQPQPAYSSTDEFIKDISCSCLDVGRASIAERFVSVLVRAGASPSELLMDAHKVAHTELWLPERGGPLRPCLTSSRVTRMVIKSSKHDPSYVIATTSLVKVVLSSPQTCLRDLHIGVPLDGASLASLAPLLAAYGGLKTLKVAVDDSKTSANHFIAPLHRIISSQKALEGLELRTVISRNELTQRLDYKYAELCDEGLLTCLCELFRNCHFSGLSLEGFIVPQSALENIVAAFLESSPSGDNSTLLFSFLRTKLHVSNSFISGNSQRGSVIGVSREHAETFGPRKHFTLQNVEISRSFWNWFSSVPYVNFGSLCARYSQCDGLSLKDHPHLTAR